MSEEWKKFVEDTRSVCKYGTKCYQKNPDHHEQFKHPPNLRKQKHHSQKNSHDVRKKPKICNDSEDKRKSRSNENTTSVNTTTCDESKEHTEDVTPSSSPKQSSSSDEKTNVTDFSCVESDDPHKTIKELFLVEMPPDFYSFWEFLKKEKDEGVDILKSVNMAAVGPFEVLMGTLPKVEDKDKYLVHWRFFYDPPEFQTVLRSKEKGEFHIGYYRDAPDEKPAFVGSNDSSKNCTITPLASNIFGALYLHLELEKKKSPFTAMSHQKTMNKIQQWADEKKFSLEKFDSRKRVASVAVTKTFHGAGIVVPYEKKTQLGYRPLVETDAKLKKILSNLESAKTDSKKNEILSELQPVITYANIAMDECDFGTGLELGIDLFCSGLKEFHDTIVSTLTTAYSLLKREAFIKILQMHIKYRRKDASDLSVLNL